MGNFSYKDNYCCACEREKNEEYSDVIDNSASAFLYGREFSDIAYSGDPP